MIGVLAFLFDTIIGDPRSKFHPVVLIGHLIATLESFFYRESFGNLAKLFSGGILVIIVLFVSYEAAHAIVTFSNYVTIPWGAELLQALFLSFSISPKSLAQAGREICALLVQEKLEVARQRLSWIVGRDTNELPEGEIVRATVETIAENTNDGIIAPLFFFCIGGVPLAFLYRAANTMDSMLGYKNKRYLYFGRVAARLDDVLNFIPARMTGVLFIMSAFLLGYDYRYAFSIMRRDAALHPSPNGGYCEASMAGALHIRLGGFNRYFGKKTFRAYMGTATQELMPRHIMEAIRMMYTASILWLICVYAISLFW